MFEVGDTVVINRDGPGYTRRWGYYSKQALVRREEGQGGFTVRGVRPGQICLNTYGDRRWYSVDNFLKKTDGPVGIQRDGSIETDYKIVAELLLNAANERSWCSEYDAFIELVNSRVSNRFGAERKRSHRLQSTAAQMTATEARELEERARAALAESGIDLAVNVVRR